MEGGLSTLTKKSRTTTSAGQGGDRLTTLWNAKKRPTRRNCRPVQACGPPVTMAQCVKMHFLLHGCLDSMADVMEYGHTTTRSESGRRSAAQMPLWTRISRDLSEETNGARATRAEWGPNPAIPDQCSSSRDIYQEDGASSGELELRMGALELVQVAEAHTSRVFEYPSGQRKLRYVSIS